MAGYTQLGFVIDVMTKKKMIHFLVYDSTGRDCLIEQTDESLDVKDAIELLKETVEFHEGDNVKIALGALVKPKNQEPYVREVYNYRVRCESSSRDNSGRGSRDSGGFNNNTLLTMLFEQQKNNSDLMLKFMLFKSDSKLDELKKELKEAKNDNKTGYFDYLADRLMGHFVMHEMAKNPIQYGVNGLPVGVGYKVGENIISGTEQAESKTQTDAAPQPVKLTDEQKRTMATAIQGLSKKGVGAEELAQLNAYAEKNPAMFQQLLHMLKQG